MAGKLVVCSSCAVHVNASEEHCPHCGEGIYGGGSRVLGRTAGAVLMGLTLAGCPANDDTGDSMATSAAYGVPTTDTWTGSGSTSGGDSSTTTGGEDSTSTGDTDTTGSSGSTGSDSGSGTDTGTDTDGTTGTGTGSTGISPDYGSPATD